MVWTNQAPVHSYSGAYAGIRTPAFPIFFHYLAPAFQQKERLKCAELSLPLDEAPDGDLVSSAHVHGCSTR